MYCHCRDCQAAHGAAYIATVAYPAAAVEVKQNQLTPLIVKSAQRMRCSACGTFLFTEIPSVGMRSVNAMLLPKGKFHPQFHIHCDEALLPIVDDLPHYRHLPAAFGGSDEVVGW